jgi:hypothetical protein
MEIPEDKADLVEGDFLPWIMEQSKNNRGQPVSARIERTGCKPGFVKVVAEFTDPRAFVSFTKAMDVSFGMSIYGGPVGSPPQKIC